jgi:hypothetical protein
MKYYFEMGVLWLIRGKSNKYDDVKKSRTFVEQKYRKVLTTGAEVSIGSTLTFELEFRFMGFRHCYYTP